MKHVLLICLLTLVLVTRAQTQNYIFVLVDVSKSIKPTDLSLSKQTLTDVLLGSQLTNASVAFGNKPDLVPFALKSGDHLSIVKFGDKTTVLENVPNNARVSTIPADVLAEVSANFPVRLTDNQTYLTLAKAKIAEYAKVNRIKEYRLCVITDGVDDSFGPNGVPNYTDYERELAQGYGTSSSGVSSSQTTKLKLNSGSNPNYLLEFSPKIDVVNYQLPPNHPEIITDPADSAATIKITTNGGGKRGKEIELKLDMINISWSCPNCPQGTVYTVSVTEYDGGAFRENKTSNSNNISFKVPDGKFRITVAAKNLTAASPDYTHISVSTGGAGWIFALLVIIGLAILGYYVWNKKRQQQTVVEANDTTGVFSQVKPKSDGGSSTHSTNSDYF